MQEATKTCSRCDQAKPRADFSKRAAMKDGLRSQCRACDKADRAAHAPRAAETRKTWRANNRERVRETERQRYWRDPVKARAKVKRLTLARRDEILARRRARHDPVKARRWMAAWRARNPDYDRQWIAANHARQIERIARYRARKRSATVVPFTKHQLQQRLAYYGCCWVCGGEWSEIDHVKPLNKGGAHMLCNLRPICRSCNAAKQDQWPFRPSR